jgi:hypothetical protein
LRIFLAPTRNFRLRMRNPSPGINNLLWLRNNLSIGVTR